MCEKTAVAPLLKAIAKPKPVSSGGKMKTNQFSTFITHDTVNNESNRLGYFFTLTNGITMNNRCFVRIFRRTFCKIFYDIWTLMK
jgi:hypothetical protein